MHGRLAKGVCYLYPKKCVMQKADNLCHQKKCAMQKADNLCHQKKCAMQKADNLCHRHPTLTASSIRNPTLWL